jgi:hypothetical protein
MKRRSNVLLWAGLIAGGLGFTLAQNAKADTIEITQSSMPLTTYSTTYYEPSPCFEERVITSPVIVEPSQTFVETSPTYEERVIESPVVVKEKPAHLLHLRAPLLNLNVL